MGSINKLSSLGYALGISLGVAFSGAVYATGPITDSFATDTILTQTKMDNIKNAVNDLQGNVPSTSCRDNAGDVDTNAARVGPLCVDKNQAVADFTGCSADGTTGCDAVIALNTTGPATTGASWAQAQRACINAGKRLLTAGEWLAAYTTRAVTGFVPPNSDNFEFVGTLAQNPTLPGSAQGGFIGPRSTNSGKIQLETNQNYDALVPDTVSFSWRFRCGR